MDREQDCTPDEGTEDWLRDEASRAGALGNELRRKTLQFMAEAVRQLREQRDELQREICMIRAPRNGADAATDADIEAYALNRGWTCFDERREP